MKKLELIAENKQLKSWCDALEERLARTEEMLKRAQDALIDAENRYDELEKRHFDLLAERSALKEEHEAAMSALRDIALYSRV